MNLDEVVRQYVPTRPPYVDNFISQTMMGMAARKSTSLAKITGAALADEPEPLTVEALYEMVKKVHSSQPTVIEEWWAEEGMIFKVETSPGPVWVVHPSTWLDVKYPNRHPRYTLGHAEARRDNRKYKRGK